MPLTMDELLSVPLTVGPEYGPERRKHGANVSPATMVSGEVRMRRFRGLPLRNDEVLARMADLHAAYRTRNAFLIRSAQDALENAQAKEWLRGVQGEAMNQQARGIFTTSGQLTGFG